MREAREKLVKLGENRRFVRTALAVAGILAVIVILFVTRKPYKSVSVSTAEHMMEAENVRVVDVRNPDEYADGHIPGAVNVPIEDLRKGDFGALPEKDETLLIYCYAGRRSKEAAEILLKAGYKNAFEFGGIVDWTGDTEKDGNTLPADS